MSLKLLITRVIDEDSDLLQLEHVDIYSESFIQIEINKSEIDIEGFDWVFFSSANGIIWADENKIDLSKVKVAAIGSATEKAILEKGYSADFVGEDHKLTEDIIADFNEKVAQNSKCLFPVSSRSKKKMLKQYTHEFETIVAYNTELDPIFMEEEMDIYVFTSPSNFQSFFSANRLPEDKIVVAIGETTKTQIEESLNISIFTPKEKTETAIYELLKDLIPSHFPNKWD